MQCDQALSVKSKLKYVSCKHFSNESGLPLHYVVENFSTTFMGVKVVPAFMLDDHDLDGTHQCHIVNCIIDNDRESETIKRTKMSDAINVKLSVNELQSNIRLDFDELDRAYEAHIMEDFHESDAETPYSAEAYVVKKTTDSHMSVKRNNRRIQRNRGYAIAFTTIIALSALAFFIYKHPPAYSFLMDKLIEYGLIRVL